ncbi:MAG: nitrogen fixation protein NifM [Rhodocyclales bacterium RIFCSPLOWO2_02_FULL_63_24]|nr:MAG: nitrogen fixation protein NifM [Rhodocyclales bacterium RIFCSPLOWO2_02_FULL_63_24]
MTEPDAVYLSLKLAAQLFEKPLEALAADELRRVKNVAAKQHEIEALILQTPEAARVMLPEASIEACLKEIRGRYASEEDYHADLDRIGLDGAALRQAVLRDLRVEAVLEKVGAHAAAVSETEVEIFWFMHKERFRRVETRVLRHILVTVNDALPGSERDTARAAIEAIRARLLKNPERFAEQALKHSECPTAMHGGLLGAVPRGQLYAELEAAAFALAAGELSIVVESELGFHLLLCDAINEARTLSLAEARPTIREHLEQQRRGMCQKSWINALRRQAVADAA